jgi:hypothetical protein
MASELSPQSEQYLTHFLAIGLFASREEALDAAIAALKEQHELDETAPANHLEIVEASLDEYERIGGIEMTADDWQSMKQRMLERAQARNTVTE